MLLSLAENTLEKDILALIKNESCTEISLRLLLTNLIPLTCGHVKVKSLVFFNRSKKSVAAFRESLGKLATLRSFCKEGFSIYFFFNQDNFLFRLEMKRTYFEFRVNYLHSEVKWLIKTNFVIENLNIT